jgi:D-aminopeptidase
MGGYHLGVLVQTNFGGQLQIMGRPMADLVQEPPPAAGEGSIMILVASDAPLSDRNLQRLARRFFAGLARCGSSLANGLGDYAIAFSTATAVRRKAAQRRAVGRSL